MARKKKEIPTYGTVVLKGVEYYRTRIEDADGRRVALYARTPEELLEKVEEAQRQIEDGGPLSYTQFKRVWQYIVTRSTKERTYVRYINGQKIQRTVTPKLGEKAAHNGNVVYTLENRIAAPSRSSGGKRLSIWFGRPEPRAHKYGRQPYAR